MKITMHSLKLVAIFTLFISVLSCKENVKLTRYQPYKFDIRPLDSLVKLGQVILDETFRPDSTLQEQRYYLGDTVKYHLTYNKSGYLLNVSKFVGPEEVWTENYWPNGQRMSHFDKILDPTTGGSYFHGPYKAYYESGWLKEQGEYKMDQPTWVVNFTEDGTSGDTIVYVYQDGGFESNK